MPAVGQAGIVLEGMQELQGRLNQLDRNVRKKLLTETLLEAAEITRARAAELAPVRTGRLRREQIIKKVSAESTADTGVVLVGPSRNAFYGLFQELGTAFMTARPFLGPAFTETQNDVLEKFTDDFTREVLRITNG